MKMNKNTAMGVALAAAAIAGATFFLTGTKKGKEIRKMRCEKRKQMAAEIRDIINDARMRIRKLKTERMHS